MIQLRHNSRNIGELEAIIQAAMRLKISEQRNVLLSLFLMNDRSFTNCLLWTC